jgi:hypothetical protein
MEEATVELRIYAWAKSILERELHSGFALIRSVRCASAIATCEILKELSASVRRELVFTSLRVFHPDATRALGETLSQEELQNFDRLREQQLDQATEIFCRARESPLDKRTFRRVATNTLRGAFGEPTGRTGRSYVWYEEPCGSRTIRTVFKFAPQPSYWHQVMDASRVLILPPISLLPLVGFFSETVWDAATRGEEEATALAMRDLGRMFLDAADDLI